MAYDSQNLSVLAHANGFTLWHYRTEDNPSTIDRRGYFKNAASMFRPGDVLIIETQTSKGKNVGLTFVSTTEPADSVDTPDLTLIAGNNSR